MSALQLFLLAIAVPPLLVILAALGWQNHRASYDQDRGDRNA